MVCLSAENAQSAPATNRGSGSSGATIIRPRSRACVAFHSATSAGQCRVGFAAKRLGLRQSSAAFVGRFDFGKRQRTGAVQNLAAVWAAHAGFFFCRAQHTPLVRPRINPAHGSDNRKIRTAFPRLCDTGPLLPRRKKWRGPFPAISSSTPSSIFSNSPRGSASVEPLRSEPSWFSR